jgi:hypothetical protein
VVDAHAKLRAEKARGEEARRQKVLRDLAAELVTTGDGKLYREAIGAVPDEDWHYFHLYISTALYRPTTLDTAAELVHANEKSDLLAEEYRRRQIEAARGQVERVARMDVPGVTT